MKIHENPEKLSSTSDIINSLDISVSVPSYRSLSIMLRKYDFSVPLSCHSKSLLYTEFPKPHFLKGFEQFYIYAVQYYRHFGQSRGNVPRPKIQKVCVCVCVWGGVQLSQNPPPQKKSCPWI